eukprot:CAMPEP_0174350504 /NCGR_PEP_ID=MMETSP0811_2-20130205/7616_1 /TAXON_ID=73025 ORGANISM="Eutreptiella gymnastica-like, Strain CCMP1594" /NCGR_SAMPLE_ID=MMETSP0811_2 /ASSEMBLY_ACC=CAM_ASM_000667 /LENGTH=47 /DNA_ID= /DNA_START= /DNA_END= /DNA_ORIENTATION=
MQSVVGMALCHGIATGAPGRWVSLSGREALDVPRDVPRHRAPPTDVP